MIELIKTNLHICDNFGRENSYLITIEIWYSDLQRYTLYALPIWYTKIASQNILYDTLKALGIIFHHQLRSAT